MMPFNLNIYRHDSKIMDKRTIRLLCNTIQSNINIKNTSKNQK